MIGTIDETKEKWKMTFSSKKDEPEIKIKWTKLEGENGATTSMNLNSFYLSQVFAEKADVSALSRRRACSLGLLPHRLDCAAVLTQEFTGLYNRAEGEVFWQSMKACLSRLAWMCSYQYATQYPERILPNFEKQWKGNLWTRICRNRMSVQWCRLLKVISSIE